MKKKWYKSSTIWINVAGVVILALEFSIASFKFSPEVVALAVAVLNILNRFRAPKRVASIEKSLV